MPRYKGDFTPPITLIYEDGSTIAFHDVKQIDLEDKGKVEISFNRFRKVEIDYDKTGKKRIVRII